MNPVLSKNGQTMFRLTGVRAIMKDIIATTKAGGDKKFIDLSSGNPLVLPEVEKLWKDCTLELLNSPEYGTIVGRYGSSQGYQPFIDAIVADFNSRYGWNLSDRNVLITPGSQSIYFYAANAFGGYTETGTVKKVVLPLSPDYTGYGGVSLASEAVVAYKPNLEIDENARRFKYIPNLSQLSIDENTGCVIFSRPCNPTGNVISDEEVEKIGAIAAPYNVPVFVDSAYAPPYPALNLVEMKPIISENIVHCMSLSKAGLAGERIGVAIGNEKIISVLQSFQTNSCIHAAHYGQAIGTRAITSGALAQISEEVIRPFYQKKFAIAESTLDRCLPKNLRWYLHRCEGGIFVWLWLPELPVTDWEFYQKLKEVGVILVPGSSFFPGLQEEWPHKQQCLRISLTASDEKLQQGMERLAQLIINN